MDTPKIDRILIEDLELIDSRVINVFDNVFGIQIENINLGFVLIEDKSNPAAAEIDKINENTFEIRIYNLLSGGLRGILKPIEIGCIDDTLYYFSLVGLSSNQNFLVSFNLFKEVKNG